MIDYAGPTSERPFDDRARLLAEMRRIKETSGLSFGRLADRTHYSRSSWERFLNGKQLPTSFAIQQLAEVTGEDPAPLLTLLERITTRSAPPTPAAPSAPVGSAPADSAPAAPSASAADSPGQQPEPATEPRSPAPKTALEPGPAGLPEPAGVLGSSAGRRRHHLPVLAYVAAGVLLGSIGTGLVIRLSDARTTPAGTHAAALHSTDDRRTPQTSVSPGTKVGCRGDVCIGRDPQAMDCQWDAVTAHETWLSGMHIQLRYSQACQAVWGRIEKGTVGDSVRIKNGSGLEMGAEIRVDRDTYTEMLDVSGKSQAMEVVVCGMIPSQKDQECSPDTKVQP